jgi:hypothetical protein
VVDTSVPWTVYDTWDSILVVGFVGKYFSVCGHGRLHYCSKEIQSRLQAGGIGDPGPVCRGATPHLCRLDIANLPGCGLVLPVVGHAHAPRGCVYQFQGLYLPGRPLLGKPVWTGISGLPGMHQ